jgi:hypothetical protein
MALLMQMIRTAAITGQTDRMNAWFADRQGAEWAERTMGAALPELSRRPSAAARLRELTELHRRGVIDDAELERLRERLGV